MLAIARPTLPRLLANSPQVLLVQFADAEMYVLFLSQSSTAPVDVEAAMQAYEGLSNTEKEVRAGREMLEVWEAASGAHPASVNAAAQGLLPSLNELRELLTSAAKAKQSVTLTTADVESMFPAAKLKYAFPATALFSPLEFPPAGRLLLLALQSACVIVLDRRWDEGVVLRACGCEGEARAGQPAAVRGGSCRPHGDCVVHATRRLQQAKEGEEGDVSRTEGA